MKTAIVGTGIAGMGCGHFLQNEDDLTFYEQNNYIGGHSNTVTADEDGKPVYIDTGFMVFNRETYPNLCKLFDKIKAPVKRPICRSAYSMSPAVWSTPMEQMLDFPAGVLIRFFKNHGFLGLDIQHQWYTLHNGSQA